MLVDRLPLPLRETMRLVCHWANGIARFVLCRMVMVANGVPLVALRLKVVPLTLMPDRRPGEPPPPLATTRFSWPPLTWSDAEVPPAMPPPVTVTEDGA